MYYPSAYFCFFTGLHLIDNGKKQHYSKSNFVSKRNNIFRLWRYCNQRKKAPGSENVVNSFFEPKNFNSTNIRVQILSRIK